MKPLVLLIDDDLLVMQFYVQALEKRDLTVKQILDPDTTLAYIEREKPDLRAAILDVMMPPGERYSEKDTDGGLETGAFLYTDLRKRYPKIPIIVLTNMGNQKTLSKFTEEPYLRVVQKLDYPPLELAALLDEMLSGFTSKKFIHASQNSSDEK